MRESILLPDSTIFAPIAILSAASKNTKKRGPPPTVMNPTKPQNPLILSHSSILSPASTQIPMASIQDSRLECYYCKGASEGRYYAEKIITEIEERGNIVSRNAKPADYYVLKNTSIPAVLVEVGYLSNYNERTDLMSEEYQERIAIELVEGIVKGFEGKSNHLSV